MALMQNTLKHKMLFSNYLLITCQSRRKQISLSNRSGFIDLHLWNSSCFAPCRRRGYSFRSAGKGDSENRGWRGCWDKNRLKRTKNIVHSVLSWVSFKSEVWNYVYKIVKYVLSLDASKVDKTRLSVLRYRMRLPCFRGKGQTQRVAAFWHKSIDKAGVTTSMHCTAPYSCIAPGKILYLTDEKKKTNSSPT